jgi:ubiquitin carboxyl-terminal hydrolase 14
MSVAVSVSWGSKKSDLAVDPLSPVSSFMETLFQCTSVPVDRQTLLCRRRHLKPTDTWDFPEFKPGLRLMLIGTNDPTPTIVVRPDTPPDESAGPPRDPSLQIGLRNLGNTCYLNSILQVLRLLPDFVAAVASARSVDPLSMALSNFFKAFPTGLDTLIGTLRATHPEFAKRDEQTRQFVQQDAAECWGVLMHHVGSAASLFEIHLRATSDVIDERAEVDDRLRCHIGAATSELPQPSSTWESKWTARSWPPEQSPMSIERSPSSPNAWQSR